MNSGGPTSSGPPPNGDRLQADHRLGQQLAQMITAGGGERFEITPILSQVQDLLGDETALIVPMRDLLQRPSFRALFSGETLPARLARRDALLADLSGTYTAAILDRLALVIDGCIGLPASTNGHSVSSGTARPGTQGFTPPPSANPSTPSWAAHPSNHVPSQPPIQVISGPPSNNGGGSGLTAGLIVLVSLLVGGLMVALGWILLLNRPTTISPNLPSSPPERTPSPEPNPSPAPTPKDDEKGTTSVPEGAWGPSSAYKFGRLPGGDYPHSCAFSMTDEAGQKTIDTSTIEYWACRDIGGDTNQGFRVAWSDGKETVYTFQEGGGGNVVGTNGTTYPMTWRNDTHKGSSIIVISHEDGATTWIPGQVQ